MVERFNNKYRIASTRANWYSYYGGTYFVTICTSNREHFFGEIDCVCGMWQMNLSVIGQYVLDNIRNISTHYPYAEVPVFVVMPNHVHMIVCVQRLHSTSENADTLSSVTLLQQRNSFMASISPKQGQLSTIVRGLKSTVTAFSRQNGLRFAWQPRFHEHIVRDQSELNRIVEYIQCNISNWQQDELNITLL